MRFNGLEMILEPNTLWQYCAGIYVELYFFTIV